MYRIDKRSEVVREIQSYLRALGNFYGDVPKLSIDGIYGDETREAVRLFQERAGILPTGATDKETFEALFAAFLPLSIKSERKSPLFPPSVFPIRPGDDGDHVRIVQSVLEELFWERIPSDGFYGRATENGVRLAQKRYGMEKTGILTQALWERLCEDYRSYLSDKIMH